MTENGVRCQNCNKKVGLWIGEAVGNETHYNLYQTNPDQAINLCDSCYGTNQNQYLKDYKNISKVEKGGTTWIRVKKDGVVIENSYYKCLTCGNKEHPNDLPSLDTWCSKCDSKGVEIKFGNDIADERLTGFHYVVKTCSDCQKEQLTELYSWPKIEEFKGKSKGEIEKIITEHNREKSCKCSNKREREREREREQKWL